MTNKLTILNSFTMPAEDETFEVTVSDIKSLAPNCWLWNESVGYLEVVKYSLYSDIVTVKNLGRRENAKRGTEFPTCMEFLITAPTALDPYNPLSTCLAADFNSPTVGQEAYMSVGSTYVIKVDDQIIVDGDYRYAVTQIVNATTLKVRNEGLGKEGIIEVGCDSCVPVQVVSKLNCCPIPSGDLTSNTPVLTVNNGYDVLLDNASLTLDTDLSKYDNSSSEFITLNDVPRGTLNSSSNLVGVSGGVNNVLGNITLSLDTDLSKYNNSNSEFITVDGIPRGELYSSTNVLTVNNGANNVLGNIELSLDKDLSKYNNTTSAFITLSDIPRGSLTSTTSLISVVGGTNNVLSNISLTLDTDLSKYDNTTSGFLTPADKKNLTSNTSVLTVTDGTGATLENTILELDTDLSKYDNSNSGFITSVDGSNLTSNSALLIINNGTGTTLKNTSISLNTDLALYDNSNSNFLSASSLPTIGDGILTIQQDGQMVGSFSANSISDVTIDIPGGGAIYEKEVTTATTSDYFMIDPNGAWDTTSYGDNSYTDIFPQKMFINNDTLYITSPAGARYRSDISSDTPTLSGSIPAWNTTKYTLVCSTDTGYYRIAFSSNEYRLYFNLYDGTSTEISRGYVTGATYYNYYRSYSIDVDYTIKDGFLYIIFSGCLRYYSDYVSWGGFVRSVKVDLSDNSCTPYTITYNNTSYSPSSIPSNDTCRGHSRVFFIGDPESTDQSPVACVELELVSSNTQFTHVRGYWDSVGNLTTTSLPNFLGGATHYKNLERVTRCSSNSANIAFIAIYLTQYSSSNPTIWVAAYTSNLTEVWAYSFAYPMYDYYNYRQHLSDILIDGDNFYIAVYYVGTTYDYNNFPNVRSIVVEKRDVLTGTIQDQLPKFVDRSKPYSFAYSTASWNALYGATYSYVKDITIGKYNNYLIISTVSVSDSDVTTSDDVKYYWTIAKISMDPVTDTYLVADKDIVSSSSTGSLGTPEYPWNTGYINDITTSTVTFAVEDRISSIGKISFIIDSPTNNRSDIYISNTTSRSDVHFSPLVSSGKSFYLGDPSNRWNTIYSVNALNTSCDIRIKDNIIDLDMGLDAINDLDVKSYTIKGNPENISYGIIAQDTFEKHPELISIPHSEEDSYGVYTGNILFLAVKAIQELSSKVEELNAKIKLLEGKL